MIRKFPTVNFIGNKEKIATWICDHFPSDAKSIFDAFSGGCSIGYEAKIRGYKVISNDILKINSIISKYLIENNNEILDFDDIKTILSGEPSEGFMTSNYADVFFFKSECMELDLYRKNIEKLPNLYKKSIAFSLFRRAMIRKMPYSRFNINWEKVVQLRDEKYSYEKYKRKRAYHNQSFKTHFLENVLEYNNAVFDNKQQNLSFNEDVFTLLDKIEADIIYLDPPYTGTMNNYFDFYGLFDEFITSEKQIPFENNFIDKKNVHFLFDKLFSNLRNFKYWILSYNNSSVPNKEQILVLLNKYSHDVQIIEKKHDYKITGKINKETNTEYLFIVKNPNFISKTQSKYETAEL